jgi:hypothetical protein
VKKDKEFLVSPLYVFGYDKNQEINGAALSEYNTGTAKDQKIGDIVFGSYNMPDKLTIRKGLLTYINDHTTANNLNMILWLYDFIIDFGDPKKCPTTSFESKMLAYAGTLEYNLHRKYDIAPSKWPNNPLLANFKIQWPKFIDELKKKDYYNDPIIKKAVAAAEDEAQQLLTKPDPE